MSTMGPGGKRKRVAMDMESIDFHNGITGALVEHATVS